jgi:hypothetical protein
MTLTHPHIDPLPAFDGPAQIAVRPLPRGPLSAAVLSALGRAPGTLGVTPPVGGVDALADDDFGLALYLCYELHYRDMPGVDPGWEWDPGLLAFRNRLERAFLTRLRHEVDIEDGVCPSDVGRRLVALITDATGPSLSSFLLASGSVEQMREFLIHRSAYQLKEADPHTFAIPRLWGDAKAAMVEIQYDEYGSGRATEMHSALFATTMTALGLDPSYGAYVDRLPGVTLATVNLISLFALHRRWRAAAVGHLALFEMTSIEPMSRYSRNLERLGVGPAGRRFYDVHVAADVRHGAIALERLVTGFVANEPHLAPDLLFGAAALMLVEQRFTDHLLRSWSKDRSSLLRPVLHLSTPRQNRVRPATA